MKSVNEAAKETPAQKMWVMAKLIVDRQKKAKSLPTDKVYWDELEGEWFDWLEDNFKHISASWQAQQPGTEPKYTSEQVKYLLEWQKQECANFTQRCARDVGQASFEMEEWITSTPVVNFSENPIPTKEEETKEQ